MCLFTSFVRKILRDFILLMRLNVEMPSRNHSLARSVPLADSVPIRSVIHARLLSDGLLTVPGTCQQSLVKVFLFSPHLCRNYRLSMSTAWRVETIILRKRFKRSERVGDVAPLVL